MDELDLAYLAGFFDGEGSVFVLEPRAGNGKRYNRLVAKLVQRDPDILHWVAEAVGFGKVYHSKDARGDGAGVYHYQVAYRQAETFLLLIRPYLRIKGPAVDVALQTRHPRRELNPQSPP